VGGGLLSRPVTEEDAVPTTALAHAGRALVAVLGVAVVGGFMLAVYRSVPDPAPADGAAAWSGGSGDSQRCPAAPTCWRPRSADSGSS